MDKTKCLLCHGTNLIDLIDIHNFPIFFGPISPEMANQVKAFPLTIAICKDCSFVQQINLLDEEILYKLYTADYYDNPSPQTNERGKNFVDDFLMFVDECNIQKGKLLEIACFDGYVLEQLKRKGWDVYGCDPSSMTKIAIENLGEERIINDFFNENTYPAEEFDVVIFRNFLEHVYDVHGFMQSVYKCIKNGGSVLIDVPNIKQLVENTCFGVFFHQHVSYFSVHTLTVLLEKNGFHVEKYQDGWKLFVYGVKRDTYEKEHVSFYKFDSDKEKESIIADINEIKKNIYNIFNNNNVNNIALFGASVQASTIISFVDKKYISKIRYIFDSDSLKQGKSMYGCDATIMSPSVINECNFDVVIITTSYWEKEIYDQLLELGVEKDKIITLYN